MGIREIISDTITEQIKKWQRERTELEQKITGMQSDIAGFAARAKELDSMIAEANAELAAAKARLTRA